MNALIAWMLGLSVGAMLVGAGSFAFALASSGRITRLVETCLGLQRRLADLEQRWSDNIVKIDSGEMDLLPPGEVREVVRRYVKPTNIRGWAEIIGAVSGGAGSLNVCTESRSQTIKDINFFLENFDAVAVAARLYLDASSTKGADVAVVAPLAKNLNQALLKVGLDSSRQIG